MHINRLSVWVLCLQINGKNARRICIRIVLSQREKYESRVLNAWEALCWMRSGIILARPTTGLDHILFNVCSLFCNEGKGLAVCELPVRLNY